MGSFKANPKSAPMNGQTDTERGSVGSFNYSKGSRKTGRVGAGSDKPNMPVEVTTVPKGKP